MKRFLIPASVCIFLLQTLSTGAQYYFYNEKYYNSSWVLEIGGSAGIMNSLTDIGGKKGVGKKFIKDLNFNFSKPGFSIYAITIYKDALGVRFESTIGKVEAYDSILKNVAASTFGRYERNLSFRSSITEFQLSAEVHPLFFKSYGEDEAPRISPYAVAGIGFFSFNPEAYLNGRWHALQPLHTEGQGFAEYPGRRPYQLKQVNIPLGVGVKYEVNSFLNVRLEIVHRQLFTDYLDDVSNVDYIDPELFNTYLSPIQAALAQQLYARTTSPENKQRGNPKDNDSYFTIQLKIGAMLRSAGIRQR